jgi:nucleotide-binding universal stress UspA family protein
VQLLQLAADRQVDAIVTGASGRNAIDLAVFGSTTNHIIRRAQCPVITVRE